MFKLNDWVIYRGNTYSFPGRICAVTDDGQYVVRAYGNYDGHFTGMKHIYGANQLEEWVDHPYE